MATVLTRWIALVAALAWGGAGFAQAPGLRVDPGAAGASGGRTRLPVHLWAERIEGVAGKEAVAEGSAELHQGTTSVFADWLKYVEETDQIEARGHVRIERDGDVIRGPSLRYRVEDAVGVFERPEFSLAPRKRHDREPVRVRGHAASAAFEGEDRYRLREAHFTTCKPGNEDWNLQMGELDLDYTRDVGIARNAKLYFKGVPILMAPYIDFGLDNQRKSGILPPMVGSTGKTGAEITLPYYFNLAPNRDLTLAPRYMAKRGLQLGAQFRYLEPRYFGEAKLEVLPNDLIREQTRSAMSLIHNYHLPGRMSGALNLNRASDDNYFRDLSSRINIAAQTVLPREGAVTYHGNWWHGGWWNATARLQSFQVLQDLDRTVPVPYWRAPQFVVNAGKQEVAGLDFAFSGEYVDFRHPTSVLARRATFYPGISLPLVTAGSFFKPKIGLHSTHYALDRFADPATETLSRNVPILSIDSGLIFERRSGWQGQDFVQTLEPRAYYLFVPNRDQSRIPLFDTAIADFNYAQIFSENSFVGGDRIGDANQLTLAATSRLLVASSGQEAVRATLAQRFYFSDQRVTLNAATPAREFRSSDWIAALSGRVTREWTVESALQYNGRENLPERITVGARYQPAPLKTLNLSYRYLRSQFEQIDVSGQWPLGNGWYGVGRFNYSMPDRRIVEGLAGFEYNAECWIGRLVVQRFAIAAGSTTQAIFFQLELNGFSRIGSNPFGALKRSIPGYARINQAVQVGRPYDFDD